MTEHAICAHCGLLVWRVGGCWDEARDTQILGSGRYCKKNPGGHEPKPPRD